MRRLALLTLGWIALTGSPEALHAQEMRSAPRTRQVEWWGGLGRNSPRWGVLGDTPAIDLALLAVRIERPLGGLLFVGSTRSTTLHVDLIPLALISPPYRRVDDDEASNCDEGDVCVARPRGAGLFSKGSVLGVGMNPLGITTRFRQRSLVSPSIGVTGGVMLFDRAVPVERASFFNFTAALEIGLRIGPPARAGWGLTYRLHHLSNAGLGHNNPAVVSHLFTVGRVSSLRLSDQ